VKKVLWYFIIASFIWAAAVPAQENALIAALKKKYGEKSSLELTFTLDIFWKVREKKERKDGLLQIMPGDKFRLKLGSWTWVCDGHTYWQYNEKTEQVIIKNLLDIALAMHPSQMMKTYLSYDFTVKGGDAKETIFQWRNPAGDKQKEYSAITLHVDKKKTEITKIVAVDSKGNINTYTFSRTKTGVRFPENTFSFTPPKGVEVIDTRD